jgi:hypothetical protein
VMYSIRPCVVNLQVFSVVGRQVGPMGHAVLNVVHYRILVAPAKASQ